MDPIREDGTGVTIRVYVSPRSSANSIVGMYDGEVKVALTAPPVEGAANKALVEFLAKRLGVSKGKVTLASGETSRHKTVRVTGLNAAQVLARLALSS